MSKKKRGEHMEEQQTAEMEKASENEALETVEAEVEAAPTKKRLRRLPKKKSPRIRRKRRLQKH